MPYVNLTKGYLDWRELLIKIELKRVSYRPDCTLGVLINSEDNMPICLTMEDPSRDNETSVSCIPKGAYYCYPYSSDRFQNVYKVKDVPGRTAILMHVGNTSEDTSGCILPGMQYGILKSKPAVLNSKGAMSALHQITKHQPFMLEIS